MRKTLLAALAALLLSGCAGLSGLLLSGAATSADAAWPPPRVFADRTTLDEKGALAVEALYTGFARAGALAFRTGAVAPSRNPAVRRDDFCPRILSRALEPDDRGMELAALECRLRAARDAARAAYDAGNAAGYQSAFANAMLAFTEGMALIGR